METWGRYWVEIVGAFLIFASSFVTERFIPKQHRKLGWIIFGLVAVVYGALAIASDRASFLRAQHDHQELVDENTALNRNMTTVLGVLDIDTNQLKSLNLEMSATRMQMNNTRDPKLMAQLSSELKIAKEQGEQLTKTNLLAMTPIIADQIESVGRTWFGLTDNQTLSLREITDYRPDTPENKARAQKIQQQIAATDEVYEPKMRVLQRQASYVQDAILRLLPVSQHTQEDEEWGAYFQRAPIANPPGDEVAYLRGLATRLGQLK